METSKKIIRVCHGKKCTPNGCERVMRAIQHATGLSDGQANEQFDVAYTTCLGHCELGPNVSINDENVVLGAKPETIMEEIEKGGIPRKDLTPSLEVLDDIIDNLF